MRKVILVIGILVVVVVAALAAAVLLVDVNRYRGVLQTQLEAQLGRKVKLEAMSLGFIPLRLQVQKPVIADDPAFSTERPFVSAENLDVRVNLSSLIRGNVDVQSLELDRPSVELVQNKRGEWNFSTLGGKSEKQLGASEKQGGGLSIAKLTVRDGQVAITDLRRPQARTIYDHIDVATRLANPPDSLAVTGNLKFNAARFNGIDVGYPITAEYDVVSKSSEGMLTINNATLQLGKTPVSIAGSIDTKSTPPRLNLSVKTGDVTIEEIARLASAFGVAFAPGTTVIGRINADVKATGSTSNPALNGKIAARDLKISSKEVPQPIEVKVLDLALSPAEIRSNNFTATSGKTNVAARFAVSKYTTPSPALDIALRSPGATLPEIQSLARAYGMTGLDQMKGDGKLDLDLHATGPVESFNSESVMRALNGTMNLDFNALKISGFDIAHELGVIAGFADPNSASSKLTDILKLTGKIAVKNGIAQTDDVKAETTMGKLGATGTADLVSQTLNLKLLAVLPKESAEKVGGTRIGGYMRTALSNNEGELLIPALVTGPIKEPKFAPDVQTFVQLQKQRFIPGYQPGQKPTETIKGILGGILGGKK